MPRNALYNVHGNVWEWCEDVWHDTYNGAPTDGSAWLQGGQGRAQISRRRFSFSRQPQITDTHQPRVDVLAHTVPSEAGYTSEELAQFKAKGTALIPTLALWTTVVRDRARKDCLVQSGADQLKAFAANGGVVLFGTDVGFTKLYDTSLELEFMGRALSAGEGLASLTTNPAAYFKAPSRIEPGFDADIVVLDGDPTTDVRNLSKVEYAIRAGKVIYQKP